MKDYKAKRMRRRALEEWRGLPEDATAYDRTRTLADAVPRLLDRLGLKDRFEEEAILGAWKDMVGDFIAEHSRPVKLERGVLFVQVLQPTLHYDLERTLKGQLLERIRSRFGSRKIRDLRFVRG